MNIKSFGTTKEGKEASLITLKNDNGFTVSVTDFGATIVNMFVPRPGKEPIDVLLGYEDVKFYQENGGHLGATVGRVGNRIAGAKFDLNSVTYHLFPNNGRHNLHSGPSYYGQRFWDFTVDDDLSKVTFALDSPDMDQGYPGHACIQVTLEVLSENALKIDYRAKSDKDTLFNMTNHSYFNLNGAGDILDHVVTIKSNEITQNDDGGCPDGVIRQVKGTVFDFNDPHTVRERIDEDDAQLKMAGGYDHNYILKDPGTFRRVASVYGPKSGISMSVITDAVGMQFYTGNSMNYPGGKGGAIYEARSGLCLETQGFPNAINIPSFPSVIVRTGEEYRTQTIYGFKAS